MRDRHQFTTEARNAHSEKLDQLSVAQAVDLINAEDATIAASVAAASEQIVDAITLVVKALRAGGRLIYVGAGTSGRLGVLDATECPPTFLTDPRIVQGVIAGGREALTRSVEDAEDSPVDGAAAMDDRGVGADDVVFGIATGGTTPFVHGAIARAKARGARTVFLACIPTEQMEDEADVSIRVVTGPEVVTGSTRMKAGTATKMVLNMVSTVAMVQMGKVYGNLMVDVNTSANAKLHDRGWRMVQSLTGLGRTKAERLLALAGGQVKVALVMHKKNMDREAASQLLHLAEGRVGEVIGGREPIG